LIHPSAIIDSRAQLDSSVSVGPYSVIEGAVRIGARTKVDSHVVIKGPTTIGADNHIYQFASLGDDPQDKKYAGEPTELHIGDGNTIREYCTINRGTAQDEGVTRVGDRNWIMAYVHIAHDCVIGNETILANNVTIAGHVHVDDYAILGGFTGVHQFCRLGQLSLTSVFTYVAKDIPAFVIAAGRPAEPRGVNAEGLRRRNYSPEAMRSIREAYRTVYRLGLKLDEAIAQLEQRVEAEPAVLPLLQSLRRGDRGLIR
jgi:UDP-N-acetylglucosamine acyltransferase